MKIVRIELFPLNLPLVERMVMADRHFLHAETVVLAVHSDDGSIGYGEAAVSPYLTGETTPAIVAASSLVAEALLGRDPLDLVGCTSAIHSAIAGNTGTKSGFDMAVHDLAGYLSDKPVFELLGGMVCERQPALVLVGSGNWAKDIQSALQRHGEGIRYFKLKVGSGSVEADIRAMSALREALGPDAQISADANGAWSREEAARFLTGIALMNPQFIEQPLAPEDMEGHAELATNFPVAIGIDEGLHSYSEIEGLVINSSIGGLGLKVLKFGSLAKTASAFRLCKKLSIGVNMSGKVGETSIANAAALHIAAACGFADWGFSATNQYLANDVVRDPICVTNGEIMSRRGAGLGVTIEPAALAEFALRETDSGVRATVWHLDKELPNQKKLTV